MSARYTELAGRHVLISGGCNGIGAAVTLAFAEQGAHVSILDRDADSGERVLQAAEHTDGSAALYPVDVCDSEALCLAVHKSTQANGSVDVLIPNAGYDPRYDGVDMSEREWDDLFALNVRHYFVLCREVLPSMIERRSGSIVMTASHTIWEAKPDLVAYNCTKSAVAGLVRSLAAVAGEHGIRVNAVAPGWTMTERQRRQWVTPQAIRHTVHELQDLPLEISPEHLVGIYLFLASDAACALTRQIIVADAGQSKH